MTDDDESIEPAFLPLPERGRPDIYRTGDTITAAQLGKALNQMLTPIQPPWGAPNLPPLPAGQTVSERMAALLDAYEIPAPLGDAWRGLREFADSVKPVEPRARVINRDREG